MDIDMHYYGTFALARTAGLRADVARRLATAAQFVDDSTDDEVMVNPKGARFRGETTSHHPRDFAPNNNRDDQLLVWLPFHFIPGATGDTLSQKLICRKDSVVAQEMVASHLELFDRPFAAELIGVTAHVYADTFAHYGFSGTSSRLNRVAPETIHLMNGAPLTGAFERFVGKFGIQGGLMNNFRDAVSTVVSQIAEDTTGALGHGSVAIFPDQPYLEWKYEYERADLVMAPSQIERQNANDYMQAAQALYGMFRTFAERRPEYADPKGRIDFAAIEPTVRGIVSSIQDRDGRIALWQKACIDGKLFKEAGPIPDYEYQEWRNQTRQLATLDDPQSASGMPAYHFHQAAALHKHYVLRDLLPKHGIYVI